LIPLTERQKEACMLMCDGANDRAIAIALGLRSASTIATRIRIAMQKTGTESREALAYHMGYEAGKKAREKEFLGH
jgi:DNA-binding NarL/FixJ family response regulator